MYVNHQDHLLDKICTSPPRNKPLSFHGDFWIALSMVISDSFSTKLCFVPATEWITSITDLQVYRTTVILYVDPPLLRRQMHATQYL